MPDIVSRAEPLPKAPIADSGGLLNRAWFQYFYNFFQAVVDKFNDFGQGPVL